MRGPSLNYKLARAEMNVIRAHMIQAEKMRRVAHDMEMEVLAHICARMPGQDLDELKLNAMKACDHEEAKRMNWECDFQNSSPFSR